MILTHLPIWAEDAEIHGVVITAMDVTSLSAAMRGKDGEVGMAEQEKREKVIKGLECCKIPFTKCYDGGCPYFENDGCKARLKGDALALLKAQEPRVMTLGQVRDEADHMYLEKHSKTGSDLYGCAIRGDWDGYGIELLMSEYDTARERWSDYGKTWRCWTSRPTDEQREAVKWE